MKEMVAIVGARRCTQENKYQAVKFTEQCVKNRQTVISGMAKGIDSYAHTACLKAGGYTVTIVGNGLDICYPSEHKKLMDRIAEKGLLLSEYPPGKGSGALITAEYGRKYGREVKIVNGAG